MVRIVKSRAQSNHPQAMRQILNVAFNAAADLPLEQ